MSKTIQDLDEHLFAQLDRISRDDMSAEDIERESNRASAIVDLADQLIESKKLKIAAAKLFAEHGNHVLPMLPQIAPPAQRKAGENDK